MANSNDALLATMLQEWRIKSSGIFKNEFMRGMYGAKDFYLAQTSMPGGLLSEEIKNAAHASTGRTIKIPVFQRSSATISSGRSCTIPNNEVTSAKVGVTFNSYSDGFRIYPNRYVNNEFGLQEHFNKCMEDMMLRWYAKFDQLCLANLSSNKNTVWTGANLMGYSQSGNTIQAAHADRDDFMMDYTSIMQSLGYYGHMNVIGNSGVDNIFHKLYERGTYNDKNLAYEYADKSLFVTSNLSNANGKYATMYMVPDGQVGILSRVSRAEAAHSQANEHTWGTTFLPGMGDLMFGTHTKVEVGDMAAEMNGSGTFTDAESSVNDMTCDYAIHYGFAIDIAFVNAYNSQSATRPEPIIKAEVANKTAPVYTVAPAEDSVWPNA